MEGSTPPDMDEIKAWLKEESLRREKEVQAAQRRVEEERARLRGMRQDGPSEETKPESPTQDLIREVCDEVKELVLAKNAQYGDSATNPVRIFSKASTDEQLRVRLDDKLSRIARGDDSLESDDEIINDLIGYLIMLKVWARANS